MKKLICDCGAEVEARAAMLGEYNVWAWYCDDCEEEYCVEQGNEIVIIDDIDHKFLNPREGV